MNIRQKKWQLPLILAVIGLTIYNILPTIFYYSKPLRNPINAAQAAEISDSIATRVNRLENESIDWLNSFCELIHVKPLYIKTNSTHNQWVTLSFAKNEEAAKFRAFLPRAGSLIPFIPAKLSLAPQDESSREVIVQRMIQAPIHKDFFVFASKKDPGYRELIIDRAAQIAFALAGPTDAALAISQGSDPYIDALASHIISWSEALEKKNPVAFRYAAGFTQGPISDRQGAIQGLIASFERARDAMKIAPERSQFEARENKILKAEQILKKHFSAFAEGGKFWQLQEINNHFKAIDYFAIGPLNPFFSEVGIDWSKEEITLKLHPDVSRSQFEQELIDELAKINRLTNEKISATEQGFSIPFHQHSHSTGFIALKLDQIGESQSKQLQAALKSSWHPKHPDFLEMPIVDVKQYQTLQPEQKAICLVISSPANPIHPSELKNPSIYVIAKGIDRILRNFETHPDSELAQQFNEDFQSLAQILRAEGYFGFRPSSESLSGDFVFECPNYFRPLLAATREEFLVKGTQKYAFLEVSDLEQRMLTENKIDNKTHEDLIRWQDEYRSAQVSLNSYAIYDVPKPTKNIFWSNVLLSAKKFIRGDDRKILRWGLDLSGGKTVQIELRDAKGDLVTGEEELKQGINELYKRVNKMGVSEVVIRQVGHHIVLDFPGSQALSANELIKSSKMYFHVVNEKFSPQNPEFGETTNRFLQEIWNEAIVTGKTDPSSLQQIAYKHLDSEAGKTLIAQGLKLQAPDDHSINSSIEDSTSKIAVLRGDAPTDWYGQGHPLMIVFRNFAMEGSQLDNIRSAYDPSKGNYLSFEIRNSNDIFNWTLRYSKEKIAGTVNEKYSRGQGWRMAVILNDTIISSPTLNEPLQGSAMISGSFSQREVNQLAADLKAGSLTYTPNILFEKNVSPELGKTDRIKGITATAVALLLVIGSMILYYRFAGLVASIAVLLNILILWATLQNLGATLSLAGIAGIILTIGMAVDANVLVFERVKEEFSITGRIGSALNAGYDKAYSAIIDSNVTTIIAAIILLNFDAGPIKNFAVNLIIGIASSMFTALFMTRFYFNQWIQNPKHSALRMSNWIRSTKFNFLKWAKPSFVVAILIITSGMILIGKQRSTIFGMDFTGGYSLYLEIEPTTNSKEIEVVEKSLLNAGITSRDFQIRELNPSNHVRLLFGTSMEQKGKPFHGMETVNSDGSNPRIEWVVSALQNEGVKLNPGSKGSLSANWTAMSGQMSDSMRNNALLGLLISFVCIFIYLAFRFEYQFAAAALICLIHDVLITIGLMGLFHAFGMPVQIDLNTIAAIMTIVGYSLNDTIIIFDRIREEMRLMKGKKLSEIVNIALNATLSRTTITSGTTLLVLIALVVLGGASIFSFALVMTIGVFFGTLSSWFIASPLMLFFHRREEKTMALNR